MSPSESWAKSVMPTRTTPLGSTRTHSCSAVYRRSSGTFTMRSLRAPWSARLLVVSGSRPGVLQVGGGADLFDLHHVPFVDDHVTAVLLDPRHHPARELDRVTERVRF